MARRSSHYAASFHCVLERRAFSWICWASRPRESWFSLNASSGVTRKPDVRLARVPSVFFHCSFLGLGRRIHRLCLHVFDRLLRCSTAKMKYLGAMLFAILNNST